MYESEGSLLGEILGFVVLVLFIAIMYYGYPVSLYCLGSVFLYAITRKHEDNFVVKTTNQFLLCTSLALVLLTLIVLVLRLNVLSLSASGLQNMESFAVNLYYSIKWFSDQQSLLVIFLLVIIFLIINYYFPHFKIISKFSKFRNFTSKALVFLLTLTSFTFFAYFPLKDEVKSICNKRIERYELLIKENAQKLGELAAVKELSNSLQNPGKLTTTYYNSLFTKLEKANPLVDLIFEKSELVKNLTEIEKRKSRIDLEIIAKTYPYLVYDVYLRPKGIKSTTFIDLYAISNSALPAHFATRDVEKIWTGNSSHHSTGINYNFRRERPFTFPKNHSENHYFVTLVEQQEQLSKKADEENKEAIKGLKTIFKKMMTTITPEIDGLIGVYVKELVSKSAEKVFAETIEKKLKNPTENKTTIAIETGNAFYQSEYNLSIEKLTEVQFNMSSASMSQAIQKEIRYCTTVSYEMAINESIRRDKESEANIVRMREKFMNEQIRRSKIRGRGR